MGATGVCILDKASFNQPGSGVDKLLLCEGQVAGKVEMKAAARRFFTDHVFDKKLQGCRPTEAAQEIKTARSASFAVHKMRWWAVVWDWEDNRRHRFAKPDLAKAGSLEESGCQA